MKRFAKRLGLAAGLLAVVVGLAGVVVTRPAFITGVVLPRYARSIQTEIAVGALRLAPFSGVEARGVRVGPAEAPLLQSDLLRLRYRLWPALIGRLRIDEVGVEGTTVHVLRRPDGSTNLPVFPPGKPDDDDDDLDGADDAYDLLLRGVRLEGLTLIYEQQAGPDQEPIVLRLSDLRLELPELRSGDAGAVTLSGRLEELRVATLAGVVGRVHGEGRLGLHPTLDLALLEVTLRVEVEQGRAGEFDLAGRELSLDLALTSDEKAIDLRRLAISERHGGVPEAVLTVSGRLQREPAMLRLDVVAEPIDAALFDLAGSLVGDISFGSPRAVYRAQVEARSPRGLRRRLSRGLEQPWAVTAAGRFEAQAVLPRSEAWSLRAETPFDATLSHDIAWDSETGAIEVRALSLRAGTAARDILTAELTAPVHLRRGDSAGAVPAAEMRVRARGLPLSAANPFLPEAVPMRLQSGELYGDLDLVLAGAGPRCLVRGDLTLRDAVLGDRADGTAGGAFGMEASVRGSVVAWRQVAVDEVLMRLRPPFGEAASVRVSGQFDPAAGGRGQLHLDGLHENLLPILPPGLAAALPVAQARIDGEAEVQFGAGLRPLTASLRLQAREGRLRSDASAGALAGLSAASIEVRGSVQREVGNAPLRAVVSVGGEGLRGSAGGPAAEVRLDARGSWRPGRADLETLALRARGAERVLAAVDLSGSLALPPTAGRSDVVLTSDILDLDALAAMLGQAKDAAKDEAPAAPVEPRGETPAEIGPFDTGAAEVVAAVSLKDVRYGQARHDLELKGVLRQSVLTLDPLQCHLAGAAFRGRAQANLAVAGLEYTVEVAAAEPFAVGPILAVAAPSLKDTVQGEVTHLQAAFAGQGTTTAAWQRHLRGPLRIEGREVVLQNVPALQKLSRLWSAPEFERLQIAEMTLAAHVQDGAIHLDSFQESAPEHTLSAQGRLGFDQSLSLDLILGVGGSLQQRLQERRGFQPLLRTFVPRGAHVVSPVPISLKGRLDEPRFDRERFFSDVAKVSATTLLQGLVKEKLPEGVGEILKGAVGDAAAPGRLPELIKEKVPGTLGDLLQGVVSGAASTAPATPAAVPAETAATAPAATAQEAAAKAATEKAAAEKAAAEKAAAEKAAAEKAAAEKAAAEKAAAEKAAAEKAAAEKAAAEKVAAEKVAAEKVAAEKVAAEKVAAEKAAAEKAAAEKAAAEKAAAEKAAASVSAAAEKVPASVSAAAEKAAAEKAMIPVRRAGGKAAEKTAEAAGAAAGAAAEAADAADGDGPKSKAPRRVAPPRRLPRPVTDRATEPGAPAP